LYNHLLQQEQDHILSLVWQKMELFRLNKVQSTFHAPTCAGMNDEEHHKHLNRRMMLDPVSQATHVSQSESDHIACRIHSTPFQQLYPRKLICA